MDQGTTRLEGLPCVVDRWQWFVLDLHQPRRRQCCCTRGRDYNRNRLTKVSDALYRQNGLIGKCWTGPHPIAKRAAESRTIEYRYDIWLSGRHIHGHGDDAGVRVRAPKHRGVE
jgi:hypothetical protein